MLPYGLEGNVFHNVALVLERQFPSLIIQLTVELFVVNQLSQIWHSSGTTFYLFICPYILVDVDVFCLQET